MLDVMHRKSCVRFACGARVSLTSSLRQRYLVHLLENLLLEARRVDDEDEEE